MTNDLDICTVPREVNPETSSTLRARLLAPGENVPRAAALNEPFSSRRQDARRDAAAWQIGFPPRLRCDDDSNVVAEVFQTIENGVHRFRFKWDGSDDVA